MNTAISKKYIIIPIIYAAVLTVLFVLQFSGKSTVTETLGDLKITAYTHSGGNGGNRAVERITLEHPAVSFDFSRNSTLLVRTELGRTVTAGIRDFSLDDTGAELRFDEGIVLDISVSSDGLTVSPRLENPAGIETLEVPYRFPEAAGIVTAAGLPAARISVPGGEYFAALPRKGSLDTEGPTFVLPAPDTGPGSIRIYPLDEPDGGLYAAWFARKKPLITENGYRQKIEDYKDMGYLGWTEGRFRGNDGWLYPSGQVGFLEETLLAAVSEAVRRLDFVAYTSLIDAARVNEGVLSFRSSVYLGGLRDANSVMAEEGWGPEAFRATLDALPEDIPFDSLSAAEGVDLLSVYAEVIRRYGEAPADLETLREIVERVIFPAIAVTTEGLFLETEPGFSETSVTLAAGRVLVTIGTREGDETLVAVGRDLIATQISASDEFGFVPGGYSLEAEAAEPGTMPLMTAEAVFEAAFPELVFPHWIPLGGDLNSREFLFTGVPVDIETNEGTARMVFSFFPGQSHFLIVRGIEELEGVELRDITWRSDPQFEIYSLGYFYDRPGGSLLINLGHRAEQTEEPVRIRY